MSANGPDVPYLLIEKRLASLQVLVVAGAGFMLMLALSGVLGAAWIASNNAAQVERSIDRSNTALACYIIPQIERSRKTLPTLDYYKQRPGELADALALQEQQLRRTIDTWGNCPNPEEIT